MIKVATTAAVHRGSRNGLAAFLLLKEEIAAAVAARHTLRFIHAQHREALGVSYRQFTRYVRKHLGKERHAAARSLAFSLADDPIPSPAPWQAGAPASEPKRAMPEPTRRFVVDPMAMRSKNLI